LKVFIRWQAWIDFWLPLVLLLLEFGRYFEKAGEVYFNVAVNELVALFNDLSSEPVT
jgi:hypothetical protein